MFATNKTEYYKRQVQARRVHVLPVLGAPSYVPVMSRFDFQPRFQHFWRITYAAREHVCRSAGVVFRLKCRRLSRMLKRKWNERTTRPRTGTRILKSENVKTQTTKAAAPAGRTSEFGNVRITTEPTTDTLRPNQNR